MHAVHFFFLSLKTCSCLKINNLLYTQSAERTEHSTHDQQPKPDRQEHGLMCGTGTQNEHDEQDLHINARGPRVQE